jgi:hypothetical protein
MVLEAQGLLGPTAFGTLRPTIVLPAGFGTAFTPAQQEAMLAHELAHLAANDPGWHLLADLVTSVLWWHPLAWWARRQLRAASEAAADESSLLVIDGPRLLATCLVELGARLAAGRPVGGLSVVGGGFRSDLGRRGMCLLRLEGQTRRPPGRTRVILVLLFGPLILMSAAAISTAWARPRAFVEGVAPMHLAWKRSLVAAIFFTALAQGEDSALGGDPPNAPRVGSGSGQPPGNPTGAAPAPHSTTKALRDEQAAIIEDLNQLVSQVDPLKRKLAKADDNEAKRNIKMQLANILVQVDELQKKEAVLRARLQALDEKTAAASARIRVFRLKHLDPEEARAVLAGLLPVPQSAASMTGGASPMGSSMMRMAGTPAGPRSMSPMAGPPGGAMPIGPNPSWRLALDTRTNSLIVRGTERDLQTAGRYLTALDSREGNAASGVKDFRVFKLKYAEAQQVAAILSELDLNVNVASLPKARTLAITGPESALKEVAEVIEAVDVRSEELKPPPGDAQR